MFKFSRIIALYLCVSLFNSCGYSDDNVELPEATTAELLNTAVLNLSFQEQDAGRFSGAWMRQFTPGERSGLSTLQTSIPTYYYDFLWQQMLYEGYTSALLAEEKALTENDLEAVGVAKILRGYFIAEAALLFGDIPFSQIGDPNTFRFPVYEPQVSILDAADELIQEGIQAVPDVPVTAYNEVLLGPISWAQFGYAALARYRLARKDYTAALAFALNSELQNFTDEAAIRHDSIEGSENLYFQFTENIRRGYLVMDDSHLVDVLNASGSMSRGDSKTTDSARLAYFVDLTQAFPEINTNPGGYFAADADYPIISFPEIQLIIAETELRAGNEANAITALNRCRNYWNDQLGVTAYIDYVAADFANPERLMQAILLEKYVSVFGAVCMYDIIRTANLIGVPFSDPAQIPQRFRYPESEELGNANFPGQAGVFTPTPLNE